MNIAERDKVKIYGFAQDNKYHFMGERGGCVAGAPHG